MIYNNVASSSVLLALRPGLTIQKRTRTLFPSSSAVVFWSVATGSILHDTVVAVVNFLLPDNIGQKDDRLRLELQLTSGYRCLRLSRQIVVKDGLVQIF